jgi:putative endonuclease
MHHTERTGKEAEHEVCKYLERDGYAILDRNWRRPWGELDIVARKDGVLHFVEVKASRRLVAGFAPTVRADARKMAKVNRTARSWLAAHGLQGSVPWQIDIASVIMGLHGPDIEIFRCG